MVLRRLRGAVVEECIEGTNVDVDIVKCESDARQIGRGGAENICTEIGKFHDARTGRESIEQQARAISEIIEARAALFLRFRGPDSILIFEHVSFLRLWHL